MESHGGIEVPLLACPTAIQRSITYQETMVSKTSGVDV